MQEPTEPDALALAPFADAVHAVVPITGADQRQPMAAESQALVEGAGAMLEQGGGLVGDGRMEEAVMLPCLQRLAFQERDQLIENDHISGCTNIMRDRVGAPCPIVRDARAHPLTGMRQPPMLYVTLDKLPRRRAQQVLARHHRARGGESHAVLQLVTEAIGAARLVEGGSRPDAARNRLVEQPAVQ